MLLAPALLVEARRGGIVESVHRVAVAVVDPAGQLRAVAGDAGLRTFVRSAAKPFQALPLVEDGAAERFAVTQAELALACASHSSEPEQVALVRQFLARLGLSEAELACGPHRPLALELALPSTGGPCPKPPELPPSPATSNCSGKHAAMLALALHHGWPTRGYHLANHPVQRRCKASLARWADLPEDRIGEAVDGCGVVTFALPIQALAKAYARLAISPEPAARQVVEAMLARPDLVAGTGRPCTALMTAYPGRLLAKVGAEGVYAAALPEQQLGIGLKVEDGHTWAAVVALWAVLEQLGLEPSPTACLPQFAAVPIRNTRGEAVGALEACGRLTFV